jgi:AcrR family transcriptional regulator
MPPKVKITKKDIINTTISLVREGGADAINARGIANALNCSTQPIFSNFDSMEDLERSVLPPHIKNILALSPRS